MEACIKTKRLRGTSIVEAAIIMPLLVLVTFGVIEYSWLFLKVHQTTNAARHGARLAIRPDIEMGEVIAAINDLMTDNNITGYSVSVDPIDVGVGTPVEVSITIPTENMRIINFTWLPVPPQVICRVTMAKEGAS